MKRKRKFDPNIGRAHWFKPGHKLGGRPVTRHLLHAAEHVAREAGVDVWNNAEDVVLFTVKEAMRGSPRHADIFFRLLKKPLREILKTAGFADEIVKMFCKLQKTRTIKEEAPAVPVAPQRVPEPLRVAQPEPPIVPRLAAQPGPQLSANASRIIQGKKPLPPEPDPERDWYDELVKRDNRVREAQGLPPLRTKEDGHREIGESFGV